MILDVVVSPLVLDEILMSRGMSGRSGRFLRRLMLSWKPCLWKRAGKFFMSNCCSCCKSWLMRRRERTRIPWNGWWIGILNSVDPWASIEVDEMSCERDSTCCESCREGTVVTRFISEKGTTNRDVEHMVDRVPSYFDVSSWCRPSTHQFTVDAVEAGVKFRVSVCEKMVEI